MYDQLVMQFFPQTQSLRCFWAPAERPLELVPL